MRLSRSPSLSPSLAWHDPPPPAMQLLGYGSRRNPPTTFLPTQPPLSSLTPASTPAALASPLKQAADAWGHPTATRPDPGAPPPLRPTAPLTHQPPPGAQARPSPGMSSPAFHTDTQTLLQPCSSRRGPAGPQTSCSAVDKMISILKGASHSTGQRRRSRRKRSRGGGGGAPCTRRKVTNVQVHEFT